MKIIRHGEVLLKQVELPNNAKLKETTKSIIVGHSESGHHHVLTAEKPLQVYEAEGQMYLQIEGQAELTHQKTGLETHGTQTLETGTYLRIIRESYSYASKVMRRVID